MFQVFLLLSHKPYLPSWNHWMSFHQLWCKIDHLSCTIYPNIFLHFFDHQAKNHLRHWSWLKHSNIRPNFSVCLDRYIKYFLLFIFESEKHETETLKINIFFDIYKTKYLSTLIPTQQNKGSLPCVRLAFSGVCSFFWGSRINVSAARNVLSNMYSQTVLVIFIAIGTFSYKSVFHVFLENKNQENS